MSFTPKTWALNDIVMPEDLNRYEQEIPKKADTPTDYTIVLPVAGWSSTAPFTQTITVAGIKATDQAIADKVLSDNTALATTQARDFGYISKITTNDGSVTVVCLTTKPTVDLTVKLRAGGYTTIVNQYGSGSSAEVPNPNLLINGNFDVWQRGDSQTTSGYGSDDRWNSINNGSTKVHSKQAFSAGQTDVPGNPKYFSRTVVSSVAGAGNRVLKGQNIEDVTRFSDVDVTLSFWAKADSSKNVAIEFQQYFGEGAGVSSVIMGIGSQLIAVTSQWKKYTVTVHLPSIAGKTVGVNSSLTCSIWFDAGSSYATRASSLGQQGGTFDIAQVKLEFGAKATTFVPKTYGEELLLCMRYYQRLHTTCTSYLNIASTPLANHVQFYVPMRITPTVVKTSTLYLNYCTEPTVADVSDVGFKATSNSTTSNGIMSFSAWFSADAEL